MKIVLNFDSFRVPFWDEFGLPNPPPKLIDGRPFWPSDIGLHFECRFGRFQDGPRPSQEPSWDSLAAILGPSKRKVEKNIDSDKFARDFGSISEPETTPKTTPKRSPNGTEIKTKNASLFYRSWTRLGSVLRRYCSDLKTHLGSKMWSPHRRNCIL